MDYLYNLKIPAFPYDKVPNLPTAGEYVDAGGGGLFPPGSSPLSINLLTEKKEFFAAS